MYCICTNYICTTLLQTKWGVFFICSLYGAFFIGCRKNSKKYNLKFKMLTENSKNHQAVSIWKQSFNWKCELQVKIQCFHMKCDLSS